MTKESSGNSGCAPILGGIAAIITAVGGLSGLVVALKGTDSPPPPIDTFEGSDFSEVDAKENAWQAYMNGCMPPDYPGGVDGFTADWRSVFESDWAATGAAPSGCG